MKVAFYVYPTAFQSPGGGERMLIKTKEYLEKEGLQIKLFDPWSDKLSDFDILHTFGSVKDCLRMMEAAKNAGVKNVLSTVCWYSWKSAWGTYDEQDKRAMNLLRHAAKRWMSWLPSQRKRMMDCSDVLLPNSHSEARQLESFFRVPSYKIRVIPNAVDQDFAHCDPKTFHESYPYRDFVLCVGRIEPRKNQLGMVRALKNQAIPVVFIGGTVPGYERYQQRCRSEATDNIRFLGDIAHGSELLKSAYAACNTFLLASWLETPGLAAMEAALAGAKVILTEEGATREYFKDYVTYVNPEKTEHIRKAVQHVYSEPKNQKLKEFVLTHYTWEETARKTIEAYRFVMQQKSVKEMAEAQS